MLEGVAKVRWAIPPRPGRKRRYRVDCLEVGQCLLIPVVEQGTTNFASFRQIINKAGKRLARSFVVSVESNGDFVIYRSK